MSAKKSRFKTPPEPSERKEAERKEKARVRMALWRESKKEEAARQRETMMDSAMQRLEEAARQRD